MIRSELVARFASQNPSMTLADADRVVSIVFEEIARALENEQRVELRGFGAFTTKKRNSRVGRNPRTGEAVKVAPKTIPFFKSGKTLLDRLNS